MPEIARTSGQLKIPYGVRDGRIIHIKQAQRGRACGCTCINCNRPLVARKGEFRTYFAHDFDASNCSPESILHKLAKQFILDRIDKCLRDDHAYPITWQCSLCHETHSGNLLRKARQIKTEVRVNASSNIVPDISLWSDDDELVVIIEVVVTHAPGREVVSFSTANNIPILKVLIKSFDDIDRIATTAPMQVESTFCTKPQCKQCGGVFRRNRSLFVGPSLCRKCNSIVMITMIRSDNPGAIYGPTQFTDYELNLARSNGVVIVDYISETNGKLYRACECTNCKSQIRLGHYCNYLHILDGEPIDFWECCRNCGERIGMEGC